MSEIAYDLEEGEIIDDVPELDTKPLPHRSKTNSKKKSKNIKKKMNNQKARNNVFAPKSKNKQKHRKSCHKRKRRSISFRQTQYNTSSKGYSVTKRKNSSSIFVVSAFKNYASPPRKIIKHSFNDDNQSDSNTFPELVEEYKNICNLNLQTDQIPLNQDKTEPSCPVPDSKNILQNKSYLPLESFNDTVKEIPIDTIKDGIDESEDEEELRRIALATCIQQSSLGPTQVLSTSPNDSDASVKLLGTPLDNYEVVDMEVEDEGTTNAENTDLFYIDTNPQLIDIKGECSSNSLSNHTELTKTPPANGPSDDDFEENLLRAELIASLNARLKHNESKAETLSPLKAESSPKVGLNSRQALAVLKPSNKRTFKRVKLINDFTLLPNVSIPQKKMIISLNQESSTEESDDSDSDNKGNTSEKCAEASIKAFISNARQKAEVKAVKINTSDVSCLSKAQQEEYSALKKILETKNKRTTQLEVSTIKCNAKPSRQSALLKKINQAKQNLKKDTDFLNITKRELAMKKQVYMKSKLKSLQLRKLLTASEKIRIANLQAWHKCDAKLDVLKKSLQKQKEILQFLEMQHKSKIGVNVIVNNVSLGERILAPNS